MIDANRTKNRMPVRELTGVQILSTGGYVPETVVTNADLAEQHGFDPEWIIQRTGIRQRRHVSPGMVTSDIAAEAGRQCLSNAGVNPSDVDLLILATATPDVNGPSTAGIVQNKLGLRVGAFDVSAACSGFMYAMVTAMQYVATGNSNRALVIGADVMSCVLDPKDPRMYPLFGDGAGAVLLGPGTAQQGLLAYTLGSDGSGADLLMRQIGGSRFSIAEGLAQPELFEQGLHYLQMDGRAVFKWAVQILQSTTQDVLEKAGIGIDQIETAILHQANLRILRAGAETLGLANDKLFVNLDLYGNTTAGSVPLALHEAHQQGRIHPGSHLLMSGFGAGLSWGTGIFYW
jgi:3-oxoacyl-[acyl-carrier-protein] synthase-3